MNKRKKEKVLRTEPFYRPRLSVELTMEQKDKLNNLIPWGMQKTIISTLIDQLLSALEEDQGAVLAAILSKTLTVKDLIGLSSSDVEKEEKNK